MSLSRISSRCTTNDDDDNVKDSFLTPTNSDAKMIRDGLGQESDKLTLKCSNSVTQCGNFKKFPNTRILREINFWDSKSAKSAF